MKTKLFMRIASMVVASFMFSTSTCSCAPNGNNPKVTPTIKGVVTTLFGRSKKKKTAGNPGDGSTTLEGKSSRRFNFFHKDEQDGNHPEGEQDDRDKQETEDTLDATDVPVGISSDDMTLRADIISDATHSEPTSISIGGSEDELSDIEGYHDKIFAEALSEEESDNEKGNVVSGASDKNPEDEQSSCMNLESGSHDAAKSNDVNFKDDVEYKKLESLYKTCCGFVKCCQNYRANSLTEMQKGIVICVFKNIANGNLKMPSVKLKLLGRTLFESEGTVDLQKLLRDQLQEIQKAKSGGAGQSEASAGTVFMQGLKNAKAKIQTGVDNLLSPKVADNSEKSSTCAPGATEFETAEINRDYIEVFEKYRDDWEPLISKLLPGLEMKCNFFAILGTTLSDEMIYVFQTINPLVSNVSKVAVSSAMDEAVGRADVICEKVQKVMASGRNEVLKIIAGIAGIKLVYDFFSAKIPRQEVSQ